MKSYHSPYVPVEESIMQGLKLGMSEGTFLTLEYIYGFEKFNTRAYHNYETWAGGWRLTDPRANITIEREYLTDVVAAWRAELAKREVEAK